MIYQTFPNFMLRSPYLPFNELETILSDRGSLLKTLARPDIQEAIYVASPVLYAELQKMLNRAIEDEKEVDNLLFSLVRYISRMSTRCTPFGLFAGCALGNIGTDTNIRLDASIGRATRLDMYYLCTLYDALLEMPAIKNSIKYYPNTSLYPVGKKHRFVEWKYENSRRKYQIAEVEQSRYLNKILKRAKDGADINTLASCIVSDDIEKEDAIDFINELIESQIILGELSQSVTGEDYFYRILELLKAINYNEPLFATFEYIKRLLISLDFKETQKRIEIYEEIANLIKSLKIPFEGKYLFQVDMIKKVSMANIGNSVIEELKSTIIFLNKITPISNNETLNKFRQDFYNRYEEKEVPLMEALDPELGIGYPSGSGDGDISPLVDGFHTPQIQGTAVTHQSWLQSTLLKKTIDCLAKGEKEIIFTDKDVEGISANWDDLAVTVYSMIEVIRANSGDVLLKLAGCGGASAANLLARFAHTDDSISEMITTITTKEQELLSDVILAEIVHLPESRIGNILSRPHIRKYELLYLASSDLPKEQILHLSDLMISVCNGKLKLRSKKMNKEIIPRLTTAHNYRHGSLPVYHFLCDMQKQTGRWGVTFNWGG